MALPRHDRRRRLRRTRGFTLVELITAASLMTVMMVGVVQIFAMITETAGQAQGNAYAMEQGRALMDSIHRDIRGFDRLGYMRIQKSDISDTGGIAPSATRAITTAMTRPKIGVPIFNGTNTITWYSSDCLALTSVNYWEGQMGGTSFRKSTGAEVVYTSNVKTPTNRFEVAGKTLGPRRGLLARGVWGVGGSSATGDGTKASDGSLAITMADLASGKTLSRLELSDGKDSSVPGAVSPINLTPLSTSSGWTGANATSDTTWQLRRVAACCVSEFLVETLEIPTSSTFQFTRRAWTVKPMAIGATTDRQAPLAIRVTIAIHDPSDRKPSTGTSGRFEGYTLQETFWVSDP